MRTIKNVLSLLVALFMIGHLGAQNTTIPVAKKARQGTVLRSAKAQPAPGTTVIKKVDKAAALRAAPMRATNTQTARVKVASTSNRTINIPKPKTRAEDPFAPSATGGTPTAPTYVAGAREDGKSAAVAMREMREHYKGMSLDDILSHLLNGGYAWDDVLEALLNYDKPTASTYVKLAYRHNASAVATARVLDREYQVKDQQMIRVLKQAGYKAEALVEAGKTVARYPIGRLLTALKANGIEMEEAAEMVRKSYGRTVRDVLGAANNAGFSQEELERVVAITFQLSATAAARELNVLNYSPSEIANIMKRRYNKDVNATAKILHDVTGATVKQATNALKFAYTSSPKDIANALHHSAKYKAELVKETISKMYNLSFSDVWEMMGF